MRQSFYVQVWPHAFDAVSRYIQKYYDSCEALERPRFKFFIFNGCLDDEAEMVIPCETLSSAITTTLSIARDRARYESFEHPLVYHVSVWQLHRNGTFHRVGYAEDEFTHRAINEAINEELMRNAIWRGIDRAIAGRIENEMDNM